MASFDSREFPWSSVQAVADGRMLTRIKALKFSIKRDKEYVHGKGDDPLEILAGNKTPEGELVLLGSEVERFKQSLSIDEDLTDYPPFDVIVALVPKRGQQRVTYIVKGVEFTEDPFEHKQNDKFQEYTIPVMFLKRQKVD